MRQVIEDITTRQKVARIRREAVVEWQTKTLANFIANTVQVEAGKTNPLVKEVDNVKLVDRNELNGTIQYSSEQVVQEADDPEVFVEHGSQVAATRNRPGSAEALMQGFREMPPK